jgi:RIO kinase 1
VPDPAFRRKNRFDDEESAFVRRQQRRSLPAEDLYDPVDGLPAGDRWSTWDLPAAGDRGPEPYPRWLVTELAAVDTELGVLKTGKEADVYLVRRGVPPSGPSCLLAAKRYRAAEHRMFHRDSTYREGRRVRQSRDNRAMAKGTAVGRQMIADQWARAEFAAMCQLHQAGVPVPYPVQLIGTEVMQEFIGEADGTAAPRLAETRPSPAELVGLWRQLVSALTTLAGLGLAHGDLSAYNLLVHRGRLIMIDLPQMVDVIAHPSGADFLTRDATNVARWFTSHGLTEDVLHFRPAVPQSASTTALDGPPLGDPARDGGSPGSGHDAPADRRAAGSIPADGSLRTPQGRAGRDEVHPGQGDGRARAADGVGGLGDGRGDQGGGRRGLGAADLGRGSGDPGRPGGGAGRADPVPGHWAEVPAPEDLGQFLLTEARLA